jgi:hypothetical protein
MMADEERMDPSSDLYIGNITLEGMDLANVGGDLVALFIHFIFGMTVVIIIELGVFNFISKFTSKIFRGNVQHIDDPDEDVTAEEERVAQLDES